MKRLKVLLLYPNGTMMNPPPISIGIFTALLKKHDFEVALFDSTLYPEEGCKKGSDEAKQENLQVKPFDYASRGIKLKETNMRADLLNKVETFHPDLVVISILECTYGNAREMLQTIEHMDIPVLAGGVFPTFAPGIIFSDSKNVKMICMGEGEDAILEVCRRMASGKDYSDIPNLCFSRNGKIVKNSYGPLIDINALPIPDYSLFDVERFFRPMGGTVYKSIPIETNRGCPYLCTFCNSPSTLKIYKDRDQNFFRKKTVETIKKELDHLIKQWGGEYVYFTSDNFIMGNTKENDEFYEMYKDIRLPFWMQSRPETIRRDYIEKLKEVGCHRASMGLEHGNEEFRIKVLKKTFDESVMINATKIITDAQIPLTVNNMIGFPDETRELIFDTIELNRKLSAESINCAVFAPFHGTPLQKVCIEKGLITEDFIFGSINVDAPLDMPQLSRDTIQGLRRTFVLYVRLPKKYWPDIQRAEKPDEEGNKIFHELRQLYFDNYMDYAEDTSCEN